MANRRTVALVFPAIALALHNLEELGKLPAWIDAHAPDWLDRELYRSDRLAAAMNALTAASALGLAPAAAKNSRATNAVAAAVSGAIVANALAHLVQLAVLRTYNPGLCSAVTLLLPAGLLSLRELHHRGRHPLPAAAIGAALSGPATFLSLVTAKRLMP